LADGLGEDGMEAFIQIEILGGHGKLFAGHIQDVNVLAHSSYLKILP